MVSAKDTIAARSVMKVIFLENVEGTAQVGEVKDVKAGFARNYLLPRKLAAPAIEPYVGWAKTRASREEKHQGDLDKTASAVAERIEGSRISMAARVGEQGKLYGSVTSVHIAAEVAKLLGEDEFDHRKVLLGEAIKEVGVRPVRLRLTRNVEATVEVEVFAEGEEPGMEAPPEAEASVESEEAEAETEDGEGEEESADDEADAEGA